MEIENKQLRRAYLRWAWKNPFKETDEEIKSYLANEIQSFQTGWIRKVRQALHLSTGTLAEKLSITRQAFSKLEKSELHGTISIKKLAEIAEIMDCELVYAIRPKSREAFSM